MLPIINVDANYHQQLLEGLDKRNRVHIRTHRHADTHAYTHTHVYV